MLSSYPACFFKEENGYSVIFPDLNYLATCGNSLDDAFAMAVDCLAGHLYTAKMENEVPAAPSSIDCIDPADIAKKLDISSDEVFVNIVAVDVDEYAKTHFEKSVRKTLTIPAWLNAAALENNINFSKVLQEALKQQLFSSKTNN